MGEQNFLASEAIAYGFKETFNNIRFALFGMFIFLCEMLVSFFIVGLPAIAFVVWKMPKVKSTAIEAGFSGAYETVYATFKETTMSQVPLSVIIVCVLAMCGLFVLWSMFTAGYIRMILKFHDTKVASLREMFMGWRNGPRLLCASMLYLLCVGIGTLLFIIPGIFILVRWSLYPFYIVDKNIGILGAFKRSFNDVRGYGWQVLALVLLATLLNMNTVLILLTIFPRSLMYVYSYRRLTT